MPADRDIADTIETVAEQPAEVSGDAGTVKAQNLRDLIAVDQYLKQTSTSGAASKKHRGLRFTRLSPPGTG